jgi:hypothetical protein
VAGAAVKTVRRCLIALALLATSAGAQPVFVPVVVEDSVRAVLAADWDRYASNPAAHERLWCLTVVTDTITGRHWDWRVIRATPGIVQHSGPEGVNGRCRTPHEITLHTHPIATHDKARNGRFFGGYLAYFCYPSRSDETFLVMNRHPFGGLQCSREAIVFFRPSNAGR